MIEKASIYSRELQSEVPASRKCLERISEKLFDWKPHEKSMNMGYLAILVADMPRWLKYIIEKREIDFATYEQFKPKNTSELVNQFDENVKGALKALETLTEEILSQTFSLKNHGQLLFSSPVDDNIFSTINHWVHHRGQLTVYMRLNDIPVPSIYGPSADEKIF
jgi:uncharacterized damage-inducible protein DinB